MNLRRLELRFRHLTEVLASIDLAHHGLATDPRAHELGRYQLAGTERQQILGAWVDDQVGWCDFEQVGQQEGLFDCHVRAAASFDVRDYRTVPRDPVLCHFLGELRCGPAAALPKLLQLVADGLVSVERMRFACHRSTLAHRLDTPQECV